MVGLALLAGVLMGQDSLDSFVQSAAGAARAEFKTLNEDQFAISVWDLTNNEKANFRGDTAFYPASVVKLFWLAFAHRQMENSLLKSSEELDRGLADMIKESSNDATGLIVDCCTSTTGGPELGPAELKDWLDKRNVANVWLKTQGFDGINVNQKTWGDGPYGRERQGYGKNFENRNSLTANATAQMMGAIAQKKMVTAKRSVEMLALLKRQNPADGKSGDSQANDFIGSILPKGVQLFSKAGWTSTTRHDVAYLKFPDGREVVLAIYTKDHANNAKIIPMIATRILSAMKLLK